MFRSSTPDDITLALVPADDITMLVSGDSPPGTPCPTTRCSSEHPDGASGTRLFLRIDL
jgi:hypothetical protein